MLNEREQLYPRSSMNARALQCAYQYAMQWKRKEYAPIGRTSWEGKLAKEQIKEADEWIEAKVSEWKHKGMVDMDGNVMLKVEPYSPTHPRDIQRLFDLSRDEARKLFHPVVLKNINEVA